MRALSGTLTALAVLSFLAGLTVATAAGYNETSLSIRLMTFNIRYATTKPFPGEQPWSVRRPRVTNQVRFLTQNPPESFVCMQEVLKNQLDDIMVDLNAASAANGSPPEWAYVGVGREDGKEAGEFSPLFYRPAVWELQTSKTVWLSETPDVPSLGWDAHSTRILTIGVFSHVKTGRQIVGMCTHLDDYGTEARLNSAKIIIDRINLYTGITNNTTPYLPVFLGGDFNSEPNQEAYVEMSKPESPVTDLRLAVPEMMRYGNCLTYTDFTDTTDDDLLIDFIWTGPKVAADFKILNYAVMPSKFEDGVYLSDHRAVVGDVILSLPENPGDRINPFADHEVPLHGRKYS